MGLFDSELKDISFSDLILTHEDRVFFRYVPGSTNPVIEFKIHNDLMNSIHELKNQLATMTSNEFFFMWDHVPFRVTRIMTVKGENYFLRRPMYPVPRFECLGYEKRQVSNFMSLGDKSGLVLFSGATGSGKSTSMYSLMTELVQEHGDIVISIEDPPEIPVNSVYGETGHGLWYQVDATKAGGYEKAMISAMRYNPKFIMMGEIRSAEAANEAVRAAVNGHLVLTTIHGGSIQGAVLALQQIAAAGLRSQELARSIIADGLVAVIHQKLVRSRKTGERKMDAQTLFINSDDGMKSKIRNGKIELLSTDIFNQNNQGNNLRRD
ncbi:ATPase, T2SS/T4P/T4SS family [Yokenella regensburgei]|uniref:ATPase, T2SS/T4P/T4SS family n=1 Tax=Yokenella regensburgei TaxID=158877 RepID=UPI001432BE81|nr:ATPase, T2SS/T4P/T4SS family [Yokenella regensburgei]QIU90107.1 Flp pilus assembly complex ATPase component TadA [Yokenella regensburgei]